MVVTHCVPLDPKLRWYPHQNGSWAGPHEPDIICPPSLERVFQDEWLLPYVDHAYRWITDALAGRLTNPRERYELPHIVPLSSRARVYVESGVPLDPLRSHSHGRIWLLKVSNPAVIGGLFRMQELYAADRPFWTSTLPVAVFGDESGEGWVPWVFMGDPVVAAPHRPAVRWHDLPGRVREESLLAIENVCTYSHRLPFLLVAFAVPKLWGGTPENLSWGVVDLKNLPDGLFTRPSRGGFRDKHKHRWPKVAKFIEDNQELSWMKTTDVSPDALSVRAGKGSSSLTGKRVAVIGVGSVGSILSRALEKLQLAHLDLIDKETVTPGNLVRHEAFNFQVEQEKSTAMAKILSPPYGFTAVRHFCCDVLTDWDSVRDILFACDLVIDATGDWGVHELLSRELQRSAVVWVYVTTGPDFGVIVLKSPNSKLRLEEGQNQLFSILEQPVREKLTDTKGQVNGLVWPEAGCHHPTFRAEYHRMRTVCDTFLTIILAWYGRGAAVDLATLVQQSEIEGGYGIQTLIHKQATISP
jgi:ThiF family